MDDQVVGEIGAGLVVFLGIGEKDVKSQKSRQRRGSPKAAKVKSLAEKIINLRIFENQDNKFDKSLLDIGGEVLVVPQFTLYADTSKGRRPYFGEAAKPGIAEPLFEKFVELLRKKEIKVEKGKFGAKMEVTVINDGPVTIILES